MSGTQASMVSTWCRPSSPAPDALLEDQHQQAVGGADGEQVHEDRLGRDDDRAEGEEQEHEAQAQDHRHGDGHPLVEEVEVVDHAGGVAGDVDVAGGAAEGRRDDGVAQVTDDGLRRVAGGVAGKRRGEHREVAGLVDDGLDGAEAAVVGERLA